MKKKIDAVLSRPANYGMVGDGFRVYNYFPSGYNIRDRVSPFLMLDFNPEYDFGPSAHPRGVSTHPHKGFETVTIAYKGSVAHHDSRGNSGVIRPGDVQWMTAGAGILHKEYHEEGFSKTGGPFEMVQLWVNLPRANKLAPPGYQAITSEQTGKLPLENNVGVVNVIAGNCNGVKGPAHTFTEINLFDIRLNDGGKLAFDIEATHNTCLLVVEGSIQVNERHAAQHEFVLFANEGETLEISANEKSIVLLLSGTPIHEPVAQYGPFVMNTNKELMEAIEEYNAGKFGHLD
jgi:redox-sensitive bicupin YhaK (pirin superfamily)